MDIQLTSSVVSSLSGPSVSASHAFHSFLVLSTSLSLPLQAFVIGWLLSSEYFSSILVGFPWNKYKGSLTSDPCFLSILAAITSCFTSGYVLSRTVLVPYGFWTRVDFKHSVISLSATFKPTHTFLAFAEFVHAAQAHSPDGHVGLHTIESQPVSCY